MTLPRQPAGIVDDRTDRRFLRLRSPPHGTLGCSTVGRAEHCSGMGCARISCLARLSWQLLRSILFWILNSPTGAGQTCRHVYLLRKADEVATLALLSRFVVDRTISVVSVRFNTLLCMHVFFHTKLHMMRRVVRLPVYDLRNVRGQQRLAHFAFMPIAVIVTRQVS